MVVGGVRKFVEQHVAETLIGAQEIGRECVVCGGGVSILRIDIEELGAKRNRINIALPQLMSAERARVADLQEVRVAEPMLNIQVEAIDPLLMALSGQRADAARRR